MLHAVPSENPQPRLWALYDSSNVAERIAKTTGRVERAETAVLPNPRGPYRLEPRCNRTVVVSAGGLSRTNRCPNPETMDWECCSDRALALQQAMQELREQYPHPYYSPFVLVGNVS